MTLEMFLVYINQSCVKTDVGKPSCWNTLSSNLPKLQRDAIHLRTHPSQVEILEFCIPVSGSGTWFHTVLYLDIILNITATKLAIFNSRIWRVPAFMCTFFSDAYPDAFLQWYYGRLKPCSSPTTHNEDDITTKLSFAQGRQMEEIKLSPQETDVGVYVWSKKIAAQGEQTFHHSTMLSLSQRLSWSNFIIIIIKN